MTAATMQTQANENSRSSAETPIAHSCTYVQRWENESGYYPQPANQYCGAGDGVGCRRLLETDARRMSRQSQGDVHAQEDWSRRIAQKGNVLCKHADDGQNRKAV